MLYDQIPAVIDGVSSVLGPYSFLNRSGVFKFKHAEDYTIKEALILSQGWLRDIVAVDTVKRVFDGEVMDFGLSDYIRQKGKKRGKKCRSS